MVTRLNLTINPETLQALDLPIFGEDDFRDFCDEDDLELTDPEGILLSPVRSASPLSEES